ncbi:MAG TPA: MBL fold metallo-hydrolase, partial [Gammaproteobacteria bacterium]
MNRRAVLEGALGAALLAALRPARAKTAPITNELALLTGFGGNVVALTTGDGLVLVDSGAPSARKDSPLPLLAELPGGSRVHTLFNTHWHLDQVGGNESIGVAGANIVAHEKTRLHLATPCYVPEDDAYRPALPVKAQPTE